MHFISRLSWSPLSIYHSKMSTVLFTIIQSCQIYLDYIFVKLHFAQRPKLWMHSYEILNFKEFKYKNLTEKNVYILFCSMSIDGLALHQPFAKIHSHIKRQMTSEMLSSRAIKTTTHSFICASASASVGLSNELKSRPIDLHNSNPNIPVLIIIQIFCLRCDLGIAHLQRGRRLD